MDRAGARAGEAEGTARLDDPGSNSPSAQGSGSTSRGTSRRRATAACCSITPTRPTPTLSGGAGGVASGEASVDEDVVVVTSVEVSYEADAVSCSRHCSDCGRPIGSGDTSDGNVGRDDGGGGSEVGSGGAGCSPPTGRTIGVGFRRAMVKGGLHALAVRAGDESPCRLDRSTCRRPVCCTNA